MRRGLILAAALLGLGLRGAYAWRQYAKVYEPIDSYEILARGLLERHELSVEPGKPTSIREPAYPVLIAAVYKATGGRHAWAVLVVHALLALGIAAMLGSLGAEMFGANVGAAAFIAYMLYPQSIYYGAATYRDTFVMFLFTLAVWGAVRAGRGDGKSGRFLAAGAFAAAVLSVASTAVALACVPACALALLISDRSRGWKRAALFLVPVVLLSGAWSYRNWRVHGRFVLGSTNGGGEMYQAMVIPPDELGTDRQGEILRADTFWNTVDVWPEAERNAALIHATFALIRRDPALYARRVAARVIKLWRLWPYRRAYDQSYRAIVAASLLSDAWMVPFGLLGFILLWRRWREAAAVPLSVLALTAIYSALHAVIRYRLPAMGFVILSAVATIDALRLRLSKN